MIKIFIVDDHAIVRQGLRQIVSDIPDMVVAGEAADGVEALSKILDNDYDVILLDISIPGIYGLDLLKQLKSMNHEAHILVLSVHPEEQYATRAFKWGASGYLTKESAPEELITAIRRVAMGRKYVSSTLAEKLALNLEIGISTMPHDILSNREYQVMRMSASGKSVKQIATELNLSAKTISTYRSRLLGKMGFTNNSQLVRYAIEQNLMD